MREHKQEGILNVNIGILGHVDSGKTSLVKALSTSLSTAALDKNPQSQQRGITLDLGFSAFALPLPERIRSLLSSTDKDTYDTLQFTLVDCPGHASLIRTIIGGSQIIDMIILVVDANKGIQTQTAECIVIGEVTTDNLVIALNKIDMLPEEDRDERIEKISKRILKSLSSSKFSNVKIIPISASVGGEKTAAIPSSSTNPSNPKTFKSMQDSVGIDSLINEVLETVTVPVRATNAPFYFAIDHCFPIKGHGTVVTGTVLSGSVSVNQSIEFPLIHEQRKVKSMQMFHKPVKYAKQGDRVGICLTNLDANLIERGVAAAPGSLPLIKNAVCLVKKIRFFRFPCKSEFKYHISIGHTTVQANVIFFGGNELEQHVNALDSSKPLEGETALGSTILQPCYQKLFPALTYHPHDEYLYQDEILHSEELHFGSEPIQYALIQFQQPIYCPLNSLLIGSRLDSDINDTTSAFAHQCRLCFYGPIKEVIHDQMVPDMKIYVWKKKECEVFRLTEVQNGLCYEAIGWKLVTEGGNIHSFLGMKLFTASGVLGNIVSPYGSDGHFRVKFPDGARINNGSKLTFKFKRYIFDKNKRMEQGSAEEIFKTLTLRDEGEPAVVDIAPIVVESHRTRKSKKVHSEQPSETKENELVTNLPPAKETGVSNFQLPIDPIPSSSDQIVPADDSNAGSADQRVGRIESIKAESTTDQRIDCAIIVGAFKMEENIRNFVGNKVYNDNGEEGELVGPFGKLGKCKVRFLSGCSSAVDSIVQIVNTHKNG